MDGVKPMNATEDDVANESLVKDADEYIRKLKTQPKEKIHFNKSNKSHAVLISAEDERVFELENELAEDLRTNQYYTKIDELVEVVNMKNNIRKKYKKYFNVNVAV